MADEIKNQYVSGSTTYAIIFNWSLEVWNTNGEVFESWNDSNITDYDIALSYVGGSFYKATFPSAITAGRYIVATFIRAGASPAINDTPLGSEVIMWDGTSESFVGNSSGRVDLGVVMGTALGDKVGSNFNTFYQNGGDTSSVVIDDIRTAASGYPRII